MIHQGSAGFQGNVPDIEVQAREVMLLTETLTGILARHTGQPMEKVRVDSQRDYHMSANEAQTYGLIDNVVSRSAVPTPSSNGRENGREK
jgi:ATP-dependent Clp protease protease subunit